MKTNRVMALVAVCLFACCTLLLRRGGADEAAKPDDSSPFEGKCLTVIGKDSVNAALRDARIRRLNNHDFLVGTTVEANDLWKPLVGRTTWIALDSVAVIYEFKDVEDIKATYDAMEEVRQKAKSASPASSL